MIVVISLSNIDEEYSLKVFRLVLRVSILSLYIVVFNFLYISDEEYSSVRNMKY